MTDLIPAWVGGALIPVEKLDAHRRGLKHKAISVFVLDGKRVLIQKRAAGKYHTPGLWANTCCTHPLWNEDPADCAVRRLGQELGITGLSPSHVGQVEYRADVGGGMIEHEVVDIFVAEGDEAMTVTPNPAEVEAVEWIGLADLANAARKTPERFTPWLRIYLSDHVERIFGDLSRA